MPSVSSSPDLPADSSYIDSMHTNAAGTAVLYWPPCCAGCSQPILDQFILQLQGHVWHAACLRCSVCNILLSHVCYSGNSQLYCQDDFFRLYGAGCSSCTEAMAPTDLVRRAHDNVYHLDCFRCRVCQHELRTGDEFYLYAVNSVNDVSKYDANICAQNNFVENNSMEAGAQPTEVRSWVRKERTKTSPKGSHGDNINETPSSLTSRVVAPPGGYPLPIVNRASPRQQLPESANPHSIPTQSPDLEPDNRTPWAGWEDLWSNDFVPPNVNLEPENLSDGEVVGFRCQNPVTTISSQEMQNNIYL
ncbi:unnamed protein product [Candidula unifasciata]|uniref:LIM zinc-binding domain-containing protein n=1 Tax=Candidula unifasciata TaxID=100452 RepID=A0A8S4A285_9EUPU|nr:unnamed protein product [Candidula unifasciata]